MLGDVKGMDYIGGVAGYSGDTIGNTVMSTVYSSKAGRFGSIAGDILEDAYVSDNRYVDEGVGAVNDMTLDGQGYVVTYEEILQDENTPEGFKTLRVNYYVGEDIIKTINVNYDSYVSGSDIPKVPELDDYNTYWEDKNLNNIKRNINIHLVEDRWNKNIAADKNIDGKAILLASALFYEGTDIHVEEIDASGFGKDAIKAYKYSIIPVGREVVEGIELRVLNEDGKANLVAIKTDNGIEKIDTTKVGSYLSFKVDKGYGEIVLMKKNTFDKNVIILGFIVICALITFGYIYKKKRK